MSDLPEPPRVSGHETAEPETAVDETVARPETLLPIASLSLGFALVLLERQPMLHPLLSYGLMLCVTAALYLYGKQLGELERIVAELRDKEEPTPVAVLQILSDESAVNPPAAEPQAVASVTAPSDASPAIDPSAFAALEKSLGLSTLLEILQSYLKNAEDLMETLATLGSEDQWQDAVRIAQDIAGAASGLGLVALTAAARNFAQKARDGGDPHELRNTAQKIVGEHLRVREALTTLYPDLAA